MKSLKISVKEYLKIRRALGYKLEGTETLLKKFIAFLKEERIDYITTRLAFQWAKLPKNAQPAHWSQRLTTVRLFAQYRLGEDARTEVPPANLFSQQPSRAVPYIYSNEEIRRLLEACKSLLSQGLRHHTYFTFFGLMAVTGCRIGELIALNRDDFDTKKSLIKIHNSKGNKSRLLPLHSTTVNQLKRYCKIRDRLHRKLKTDAFFVQDSGARITQCSVRYTFVGVSRKIGLRVKAKSHGYGPRVHDIRHAFAVKSMLRWYREGADVDHKIAYLSAYLGHKKPSDTYWYITGTSELLAAAAARLEIQIGE